MSNKIRASAPGKLVLSGEYAVLDGAPAIGMAINRRARAVVAESNGDINEVSISGFGDENRQFRQRADGLHWLDQLKPVGVVDSVWRADELDRTIARIVHLDSTEFFDSATQQKTGIGSRHQIEALIAGVTLITDTKGRYIFRTDTDATMEAVRFVTPAIDRCRQKCGGRIVRASSLHVEVPLVNIIDPVGFVDRFDTAVTQEKVPLILRIDGKVWARRPRCTLLQMGLARWLSL